MPWFGIQPTTPPTFDPSRQSGIQQQTQNPDESETQKIAQMFMPGLGIGSMIGAAGGNAGWGALGGAGLTALFTYLHNKYGKDKKTSTD